MRVNFMRERPQREKSWSYEIVLFHGPPITRVRGVGSVVTEGSVFSELLGYSGDEIAALREQGVIG